MLSEDTGVPFATLQAEQIQTFRDAWSSAGHPGTPRVAVTRSILPIVTAQDRATFGTNAIDEHVGILGGAVSRFGKNYVGPPISWRSAGVSRTEYAHRFALLIAGQLSEGVIGEHRCNEPLCVRVEPEHLIASTQSANLLYAVACGRTGIIRNFAERRDRHARSVAVRDAVAGGWDPNAYARASGKTAPLETPPLF